MEKQISFRGQPLTYALYGAGLPVLLLHGFTEDRRFWDAPVSFLRDKYQLIVPDLPGSGHSPFNSALTTLDLFAEAVRAMLEAEKISSAVLIGHSMGGYICLAFAEQFTAMVRGIGLFHSSPYADGPEKLAVRSKSISSIRQYGPAPFISQAIPGLFAQRFQSEHPEKINELVQRYANFSGPALVQYQEAMMARPDRTAVLAKTLGPVLVIGGEEDKAVPLKDSLRQSYLSDICYLHILEQTAHMGTLENTNLCNHYLDRYLHHFSIGA